MGQQFSINSSYFNNNIILKYIDRFPSHLHKTILSTEYKNKIYIFISSFYNIEIADDILFTIFEYYGFGGKWLDLGISTRVRNINIMNEPIRYSYDFSRDQFVGFSKIKQKLLRVNASNFDQVIDNDHINVDDNINADTNDLASIYKTLKNIFCFDNDGNFYVSLLHTYIDKISCIDHQIIWRTKLTEDIIGMKRYNHSITRLPTHII